MVAVIVDGMHNVGAPFQQGDTCINHHCGCEILSPMAIYLSPTGGIHGVLPTLINNWMI